MLDCMEVKLPRFRILNIIQARGGANTESVLVSGGCRGATLTYILSCLLNNKNKYNHTHIWGV